LSSFVTVLAVETSTKACSVALIYNGVVFSRHEILPQRHAHRVLEMIEEVLSDADAEQKEIDLLAFGEGPGAFTGIRIASGVVQGLALGLDVPVIGISSLQAMVEEYIDELESTSDLNEPSIGFCSMLDARMSEVYQLLGVYRPATQKYELQAASLLSPEEARKRWMTFSDDMDGAVFVVGDVHTEYPQIVDDARLWRSMLPNAVSVARLALQNQAGATKIETTIPTPVYLRNKVADTIEQRKLKQKS